MHTYIHTFAYVYGRMFQRVYVWMWMCVFVSILLSSLLISVPAEKTYRFFVLFSALSLFRFCCNRAISVINSSHWCWCEEESCVLSLPFFFSITYHDMFTFAFCMFLMKLFCICFCLSFLLHLKFSLNVCSLSLKYTNRVNLLNPQLKFYFTWEGEMAYIYIIRPSFWLL